MGLTSFYRSSEEQTSTRCLVLFYLCKAINKFTFFGANGVSLLQLWPKCSFFSFLSRRPALISLGFKGVSSYTLVCGKTSSSDQVLPVKFILGLSSGYGTFYLFLYWQFLFFMDYFLFLVLRLNAYQPMRREKSYI